jgi:hypothetical protein
MKRFLAYGFLTFVWIFECSAQSSLDAHVHGEAKMNIVLEGQKLLIEFESPSYNLVGFEHQPKTADQEKLVKNTIALLEDLQRVMLISPEANCQQTDIAVLTSMKGLSSQGHDEHHEDEHHEDEHHEDEHDEDEHDEDEHDEDEHHEDEHHEDEHHEDEHHEDEHHEDEKEIHSEFAANYSMICETPENFKVLELKLFSIFNLLEEVEVQWVIQGEQGFEELNADNPSFAL